MKKTTRVLNVQITKIIKHEADVTPLSKETAIRQIKECLGVDDVVVESIQDFTMEKKTDGKLREIADKLNGIAYGEDISSIEAEAKEAGIVIVIGASDDLMEFSGAIEDEGGCFDGGEVYFDRDGVSQDDTKRANVIEALWCDAHDENGIQATWAYRTEIPHETFKVFEDGELYCIGIVFSVEDLE